MKAHPALFGGGGGGEPKKGHYYPANNVEVYTLVRPPILPSKQMWRFIRWSDHQYKAWDIGGFCKSATGGTDHSGPTWGFIGGSDHAGPTWGFIGGSDCLL